MCRTVFFTRPESNPAMTNSSSLLRPLHPGPRAGYCGVASSLFCFEGDPHGLRHPFQKAKLLRPFDDKVRSVFFCVIPEKAGIQGDNGFPGSRLCGATAHWVPMQWAAGWRNP
jgi:hypothetical protein